MISETMRIVKRTLWVIFWMAMLFGLVYFGAGCATVGNTKEARENIENTWSSFWLLHDIKKALEEEEPDE